MYNMYQTREMKVMDFDSKFRDEPEGKVTPDLLYIRGILLKEEFFELEDELKDMYNTLKYLDYNEDDLKEGYERLLKELCDLQYVLSGTINALGLQHVFEAAFNRVHDSNMTKEKVLNNMGKVVKGKNYKAPDLEDLVEDVVHETKFTS